MHRTATQAQGKKVGEMLVERGSMTREQLLRATVSQRSTGGRLGTCLLEMGLVEEEELLEVLAAQQGVPAVRVEELRVIDEEVVALVPGRVAERCSALPFAADDKEVEVRGWHTRGEELDSGLFDALLIRLSEPSVFHNLDRGAQLHAGALPPLPAHRQIVRCWGGPWPDECLVLPVRIGDRLVAAVYGDRGALAIPQERLEELKDVAVLMSDALELRILRRKLQAG